MGKVLQDMNLLPILIRIPKLDGSSWEEITEENISEMMREIRLSLLEADVNY
jgi:signal recognition particle GTPase